VCTSGCVSLFSPAPYCLGHTVNMFCFFSLSLFLCVSQSCLLHLYPSAWTHLLTANITVFDRGGVRDWERQREMRGESKWTLLSFPPYDKQCTAAEWNCAVCSSVCRWLTWVRHNKQQHSVITDFGQIDNGNTQIITQYDRNINTGISYLKQWGFYLSKLLQKIKHNLQHLNIWFNEWKETMKKI